MLKTRIVSSVIGMSILLVIVFFGKLPLALGVGLLSLAGINEYYNAITNAGYRPLKYIGNIACVMILLCGYRGHYLNTEKCFYFTGSINCVLFVSFSLIIILFAGIIFEHKKYNLNDISLTVFGIIYVPFLFLYIVLTRNLDNGLIFVWLIFLGAWSTDTFAYFSGIVSGKTALIPSISPKKTVEGAIGGGIGCVLATVLYGIILKNGRYIDDVPLYHFFILGILNGTFSQLGDLAASAIKRQVNIKDFGKIMPGHGGILDRFDSILFIAPVVYFYISFITR